MSRDVTSAQAFIDQAIDDGATADEAVDKLLEQPNLAERVEIMLRWYARHSERRRTRTAEQQVPPADIGSIEAAIILDEEGFYSWASKRYVLWMDATAEDHRSRAQWCRGQAHALGVVADRHEQAAAAIEAAGVRCLRDLNAVPA